MNNRSRSTFKPETKLIACDKIIQKFESNEGGFFFLYAPGGTGKPFLLSLLLAFIQ